MKGISKKQLFSEELRGKRLLYLGGISRARFVVERARSLGIYVIVADYYRDSPAKAVADEAALVDATDVNALEKLCIEKKIDGVLTGYADILLPIAYKLSKRLGMAQYMTEDMISASTDKGFFDDFCNKYRVPVPKTYNVNTTNIDSAYQSLDYPIFIKPLDASGSRGASACYSKDEFKVKFEDALSYSKKKSVIVEDFLQGTEFILDYAIVNGKSQLLSMADRYSIDGRPAAVNHPNLMIMPSKNIGRYFKEVDASVCDMFKKAEFKDGLIFLQGYADDKKITFYEMGCRLGGTWPYIDEHFHGINPMDMLFCHSLTGKMIPNNSEPSFDAKFDGNAAVIYFQSAQKEGSIKTIVGIEAVKKLPYVVSVMQYYYEGDQFSLNRQTDVLFLAVHLVAENFDELKERINHVYSLVGYYDNKGESLLSPLFDVNKLEGYK